jgi:hypothetical protein
VSTGAIVSQTLAACLATEWTVDGCLLIVTECPGLKSEAHFRAGFTHLAREIVTADDPGLTTARVETFVRKHKVRPLWPQDLDASYEFEVAEAEADTLTFARL